jgi:hypothetical protein
MFLICLQKLNWFCNILLSICQEIDSLQQFRFNLFDFETVAVMGSDQFGTHWVPFFNSIGHSVSGVLTKGHPSLNPKTPHPTILLQ